MLGVALRLNSIYYWSETQNILGRIDLQIPKDDTIYISEVKINENTKTAIKQINEKYTNQYQKIYKNIVKIGINWDRDKNEIKVKIE